MHALDDLLRLRAAAIGKHDKTIALLLFSRAFPALLQNTSEQGRAGGAGTPACRCARASVELGREGAWEGMLRPLGHLASELLVVTQSN